MKRIKMRKSPILFETIERWAWKYTIRWSFQCQPLFHETRWPIRVTESILSVTNVPSVMVSAFELSSNYEDKARLKNMLVCRHSGVSFRVHPAGRKLEMEKIALILIYVTWFSSFLLRSTSCVYFFCTVHAAIMNLTYFNSHNLQLTN